MYCALLVTRKREIRVNDIKSTAKNKENFDMFFFKLNLNISKAISSTVEYYCIKKIKTTDCKEKRKRKEKNSN